MLNRDVDEQTLHDHIVQLLRKEMYRYPSPTHPNLITYTNHPSKTKAVFTPERVEVFPDVVVMDQRSARPVLVAEVETESSCVAGEDPQWADLARLAVKKLHLHVPRGCGAKLIELCKSYHNTELYEYYKTGTRYIIEKYADLA
jgi:hypothetical protein